MTSTIPDIELIQALDFEYVIACEAAACVREERPSHGAAVFLNDSCGCSTPICAERITNRMRNIHLGYEFFCGQCWTTYVTLARVTPIHK